MGLLFMKVLSIRLFDGDYSLAPKFRVRLTKPLFSFGVFALLLLLKNELITYSGSASISGFLSYFLTALKIYYVLTDETLDFKSFEIVYPLLKILFEDC